MTLSMLAKSLVFAVLLASSALVGREYAAPLATYITDVQAFSARDARISKRSIAYRVPGEDTISFTFSQPTLLTKVLVHPSVKPEVRALKEGFVYGLRVRMLGASGEELASYDIFLQADSPDEVFTSGQRWRFFRTRPELVGEQDHLLIESPSPATQMEISTIETAPGIIGVDLRVFEQLPFIGSQSIAAFRRLSEPSRVLLTEPNAFPADMLSREEILFLGRNQWRSVGANGLDGRDYESLVLYEASRTGLEGDESAGAP
ncbi:hypothetical protein [Qipengyuania sp. DGS5-3]|uniref:hypothetical protein n=1 Tax=Qipengyuania sp. DGS5-3 TaxID=3349632 RepID=UPI0036D332E5